VYPDDSLIDLIFNGTTWAGYNSSSVTPTLGAAYNAGNTVGQFEVILSDSPDNNVSITNIISAYTGFNNTIIGFYSGYNSSGNSNTFLGPGSGQNNTGDSNTFLGSGSGSGSNGNSNVFSGQNAGNNSNGDNNVIIGLSAGSGNAGDNSIILGNSAGVSNALSNQFIVSNICLPSYANNGAAVAALSGAASGNTYLYYNSTNFAIEGVRIP
jgi:hypothetical protein